MGSQAPSQTEGPTAKTPQQWFEEVMRVPRGLIGYELLQWDRVPSGDPPSTPLQAFMAMRGLTVNPEAMPVELLYACGWVMSASGCALDFAMAMLFGTTATLMNDTTIAPEEGSHLSEQPPVHIIIGAESGEGKVSTLQQRRSLTRSNPSLLHKSPI